VWTIDDGGRDGADRRANRLAGVDAWALAASSLAGGSGHGPGEATISDYEQAVAGAMPRGSAAILGVTPALRRLLPRVAPELGGVVCIDRSPMMLDASREVLRTTSVKESFIQADWLDLSKALVTPVDLIVGDMALDNLWFADWPAFFAQVALVLRAGGTLILGVGAAPAEFEDGDCVAVLETFGDGGTTAAGEGLWKGLQAIGAIGFDVTIPELRIARYSRALQTQILGHARNSAVDRAIEVLLRYEGRVCDAVWSRFTCEDVVRAARSPFRLKSPRGETLQRGDTRLPMVLCFRT
jgi:SAM-dependent methyltransferase